MSPIMFVNNALSGMDAYTAALLHCNGTDGSTVITDESGKTWTANGNAQIDTAQSKFGGASVLFDGTGDSISSGDADDWQLDGGSDANKWTIDFWVRFDGDPAANQGLITQYQNNDNYWSFGLASGNAPVFVIRSAASNTVQIVLSWDPSTATWYHVAIVKDGTTGYTIYVDGTAIAAATADTDPMPNYAGSLYVGKRWTSAGVEEYFKGWLDELRISKGVARWTGNFTPPTGEY